MPRQDAQGILPATLTRSPPSQETSKRDQWDKAGQLVLSRCFANTDWSLLRAKCYDSIVFNLGNPKTGGDWIVHIVGAIVAIFLVWWMLRLYVL
jgi:hypothetical protein